MRRLVTGGLAVAALIAGGCLVPGSAAAAPGARGPHIANACFALRSAATGRYVGVSGQGYRVDQRAEGTAAAFSGSRAACGAICSWTRAARYSA